MLKRIITSLVALCILIPVLFLSHTFVLPLGIAVVSLIALYEMNKCIGKGKMIAFTAPAYVFAAAAPFLFRYLGYDVRCGYIAFVCTIIYVMYLFTLTVFMKGKITFAEVGELFLVTVYIIAALNAIIYVRDFADGGKYLYILIFAGAWITDIFAYFSGMLFGKHKLIPEVSPKKTIEGSIGGTLFCIISFIVFGIIVDGFFSMNANFVFLAISGLAVSILAQIGDLIMSVIKRQYGVKDYGKIFPGHGGVLDRFDSILATSLAMCAVCMVAKLFGLQLI